MKNKVTYKSSHAEWDILSRNNQQYLKYPRYCAKRTVHCHFTVDSVINHYLIFTSAILLTAFCCQTNSNKTNSLMDLLWVSA